MNNPTSNPIEFKPVLDSGGTALLELVKDADEVILYEADDMDRHITVPVSAIPALINQLDDLK
ncbi:MAG TPA: hypothetical protein VE860_15370 [Chthoniobacterales bacterium]|nr:hypothetical protein [Chthoniobacterales bacterium]